MISLILILLAFIAKVFMDLSSEDFYNNSYWDKGKSWVKKNKFKPKWLFRTILVFVTDGWHLLQFIFLNLLIVSVVMYSPLISIWWDLIIYSIAGRLVFEVIYSLIKRRI